MSINNKTLIVIAGPTASGKTKAAITVARHFNTEIISFDSRQFYKEMHIGTARPSVEELKEAKHHFIGHLSVKDEYNAGRFAEDAEKLVNELFKTHNVVVAVGGSGLFMRAWLDGLDEFPDVTEGIREQLNKEFEEKGISYLQQQLQEKDPDYYNEVDRNNPRRLLRALEVCISSGKPYSSFRNSKKKKLNYKVVKIGLDVEREELYSRIDGRVDAMMKAGQEEEARGLYPLRHLNPLNTVGYSELFEYFDGNCSLNESIDKIKQNSRNYAKRQVTWFKKEEDIVWVKNVEEVYKLV